MGATAAPTPDWRLGMPDQRQTIDVGYHRTQRPGKRRNPPKHGGDKICLRSRASGLQISALAPHSLEATGIT
jgi:hypothetical protein